MGSGRTCAMGSLPRRNVPPSIVFHAVKYAKLTTMSTCRNSMPAEMIECAPRQHNGERGARVGKVLIYREHNKVQSNMSEMKATKSIEIIVHCMTSGSYYLK
jgi:hypothetical protein